MDQGLEKRAAMQNQERLSQRLRALKAFIHARGIDVKSMVYASNALDNRYTPSARRIDLLARELFGMKAKAVEGFSGIVYVPTADQSYCSIRSYLFGESRGLEGAVGILKLPIKTALTDKAFIEVMYPGEPITILKMYSAPEMISPDAVSEEGLARMKQGGPESNMVFYASQAWKGMDLAEKLVSIEAVHSRNAALALFREYDSFVKS